MYTELKCSHQTYSHILNTIFPVVASLGPTITVLDDLILTFKFDIRLILLKCAFHPPPRPLWVWVYNEEKFGGPGTSILPPAATAHATNLHRRDPPAPDPRPVLLCVGGRCRQNAALHRHPVLHPTVPGQCSAVQASCLATLITRHRCTGSWLLT